MNRTRRVTARIVATTAATATLALGGAATAQAAAADPLSGLTGAVPAGGLPAGLPGGLTNGLGGGLLDSVSGPLGGVTAPLGSATQLASAGGLSGATQFVQGLVSTLSAVR
ncbi:hypothetical protein [Streptomyces gobitricini]|uniref:ATP-binding protein n=1 Tax=Streptomyces gobitricini TaxID=68211 RepID=A0ABN3L3P1_9ACTN